MEENNEPVKEMREGNFWTMHDCPICEVAPTKYVGKRGGTSHRENLGVETEIWACEKCEFLFPNPMPFPVGGLAQH